MADLRIHGTTKRQVAQLFLVEKPALQPLKRATELGPSCAGWARAVAQNRGIGGMRSLMGLVNLVERHSFATVNRACERALAKGTWRLRDVRALLQTREIQTQIAFEEHHPLIRDLSEYGIFIRSQTQDA